MGNKEKTLIVISEGKEVKLIKNSKHMELEGSVLKYYYNEKSQAYIAKVRLIFLKPDIYYWYKEDENYLSNNSNLLSHEFGATLDRKKMPHNFYSIGFKVPR